jgi:hypothetical protein
VLCQHSNVATAVAVDDGSVVAGWLCFKSVTKLSYAELFALVVTDLTDVLAAELLIGTYSLV